MTQFLTSENLAEIMMFKVTGLSTTTKLMS